MPVIHSSSSIPKARFYVLAEDRFMSGWGEAKGKVNVVVFPAASYEEAEWIARKLHNRSEMKRIRINMHKPQFKRRQLYSLMTPSTSSFFYPKPGDLPAHLRSVQ